MATRRHSSFAIVFILGLLAMLMPLSIDMYLPALPVVSVQFGVPADSTQMTLNTYILDFVLKQLVCGSMADNFRHKPVVPGGTPVFAAVAVVCVLARTIDQPIVMRFFHGLVAATASVVINVSMRDIYPKEGFSRMISFIMLITTIAPLMTPIVGGWVLVWLSWHYILQILAVATTLASVMIFFPIKETLPPECRQPFHIRATIGNFATLFRHKRILSYMLVNGFSFAGIFSSLNVGPFAYIEIKHIAPENFGYYFALSTAFPFVMTIFNSCSVRRIGVLNMFRSRLWIQFIMAAWMVISALLGLGFWSLAIGVATFMGCVSTVSPNAMAVALDKFPHIAGTVSLLAGTFCFGIGAIVDALLSPAVLNSVWPMIWSITFRATSSTPFCLCASRPKKRRFIVQRRS